MFSFNFYNVYKKALNEQNKNLGHKKQNISFERENDFNKSLTLVLHLTVLTEA